jgi:hypothetical protein
MRFCAWSDAFDQPCNPAPTATKLSKKKAGTRLGKLSQASKAKKASKPTSQLNTLLFINWVSRAAWSDILKSWIEPPYPFAIFNFPSHYNFKCGGGQASF